jgi:hypothetical protein
MRVTATTSGAHERFVRPVDGVQAPFEEIDGLTSIECGLRQLMMDGSGRGYDELSLSSGAGLGSPWLTVSLRRGKTERLFRLNGQRLLENLIAALGDAPA